MIGISLTYMRHAQLKAFHAVATHGGFSRAADKLALTQPAISDHIRKLEEAHGVELIIGADAAVHILPVLARFRQRYPKIAVKLISGNSAQLLVRLDAFEIDFAVAASKPTSQHYATWLLSEDRLAAFVSAAHPLARRKSLTLAELLRRPVILREPGSVTRTLLLDELSRRGLILREALEIETRESSR